MRRKAKGPSSLDMSRRSEQEAQQKRAGDSTGLRFNVINSSFGAQNFKPSELVWKEYLNTLNVGEAYYRVKFSLVYENDDEAQSKLFSEPIFSGTSIIRSRLRFK